MFLFYNRNYIIVRFARKLYHCVSREIFYNEIKKRESDKYREEKMCRTLLSSAIRGVRLFYIAIAIFRTCSISLFFWRIPILTQNPWFAPPPLPLLLRWRTHNYKFPQWTDGSHISLPSFLCLSRSNKSLFPSASQSRQPPFSSFTAVGLSWRELSFSLFLSLFLSLSRILDSHPRPISPLCPSPACLASLSPDTSGLSRCADT